MTRRRRTPRPSSAVSIALLLGCRAPAPEPAPAVEHVAPAPRSPDELVAAIDARYAGVDRWSASFRVEVEKAVLVPDQTGHGRVWAQRPGRMRWDYAGKGGSVFKSVVADGPARFVIDRRSGGVYEIPATGDEHIVALSFLDGIGGRFHAGVDNLELVLTPIEPVEVVETLRLTVAESGDVERIVVEDRADNVFRFRFSDVSEAEPIDERWFQVP